MDELDPDVCQDPEPEVQENEYYILEQLPNVQKAKIEISEISTFSADSAVGIEMKC